MRSELGEYIFANLGLISMQQISAKSIVCAFVFAVAFVPLPSIAQEITSFSALADRERSAFKPLSQDQAFPYLVSAVGEKRLQVSWQPAAEHYLYKRAFKFTYHSTQASAPITILFSLKQGLAKNDEFFGAVEVYYDQVAVTLELPQPPSDDSYILIEYQGCADWGFCYPPQNQRFNF
jgi:thiol:disulfide interchange protein DsbD